jgi:hypothetical protein
MQTQRMILCKPKLTLLLFMCAIIFSFVNTWAYTPPIGIPDPGMWGTTHPIDSPAPDTKTKCPTWPAGQTTNCYYIDNTHAQATDTGNTYGYPAKPRLTIPATTYVAGAYIEIAGGPYTSAVSMTIQGTAENPVWLRGNSPTSMPDLRAKIAIPNSTYLIAENLDFNNFTGNAINITGLAVHNICIRNCKFHDLTFPGSSTAVISSTPTQGGSIHDLVFYHNYFGDIGNWQATTDEDFHAINPDLWGRKPPTTQYNIWSLNNTSYHIAGSLNQFNGDQRDAAVAAGETPPRTVTNMQNFHHMYSGKNLVYGNRQSLGSPKFSTDAVYSQNIVYANYSTYGSGGNGGTFQEGSRYVWFLFNKFHDSTYGIRSSNTNFAGVATADLRAYMIGNVIYDINNSHGIYYLRTNGYKPAQGIAFEKAYYKRYIVDNTIYGTGGGMNIANQVDGDITDISGNVFAGVYGVDVNGNPDYHVTLLSGSGITNINRCYFQPRADNGLVMFKWGGATPSSHMESLAALQSSSVKQCPNCWTGDPLFVDATNYDLHPQENSPLVGKGIRHPVYDEFQARYGINIAYDFEGKPRPDGDEGWTLGALEPGTPKTTPLPPPPAPVPNVIK